MPGRTAQNDGSEVEYYVIRPLAAHLFPSQGERVSGGRVKSIFQISHNGTDAVLDVELEPAGFIPVF